MTRGCANLSSASCLDERLVQGFYLYDTSKGSKSSSKEKRINPEATAIIAPFLKPHSTPISDKEIVERMVFRFMKECMHSLEDGVIKSAADGGAFRSACSSCDSASTNHTMRTLPFCVPRMFRYWCHLWAGFPLRFSEVPSAMLTLMAHESSAMIWRDMPQLWARSLTLRRFFSTTPSRGDFL